MRKFYVLGLALLAVFAVGTMMVSSASAETTTVWLVSGALTAVQVGADMEGTLLLSLLSSLLGELAHIQCSGIFDGFVGPDAEDEVTKILNLAGEEISGTLGQLGWDCEVLPTPLICTKDQAGEPLFLATLWPDNLPWSTLIVLMATGEEEFLDLIGLVNGNNKEPGFDFECENSNGTITTGLCEGKVSGVLRNNVGASDVDVLFLPQIESCTEPGITIEIEGEDLLLTESGLSLAVSESA